MSQPVDHDAILSALQTGESQNAVARRLRYSPATVNKVAKANGLNEYHSPSKRPLPPEIQAVADDYSLERRIRLLNRVFDKAESLIETAKTPHALQALAISLGILIDKRRLEDGEVTARTEVSGGAARERLASRLDELAARRGAKAAAG